MRDAAIVEIVHRHDGEVTAALLVHIDRTRALEPLEKWVRHEVDLPETYPTGV